MVFYLIFINFYKEWNKKILECEGYLVFEKNYRKYIFIFHKNANVKRKLFFEILLTTASSIVIERESFDLNGY